MASPVADTYAAPSGATLRGGRFASRLSGGVSLETLAAAGALASAPTVLSGGIELDAAAPSGVLAGFQLPTWLQGAAINQWVAVPNSTIQGSPAWQAMPPSGFWGAQSGFVNAENGTGLDEDTSTIWLFGGGHSDYAGNELASIMLEADSPVWVLREPRSDAAAMKAYGSGGTDPIRNTDGKPNSRHSYQGTHFIRKLQKYFAIDGYTWDSANNRPLEPATWDVASGDWDPAGTWTALGGGVYSSSPGVYAKHPTTEDIWHAPGGGYGLYKLDTTTKAWSTITSSFGSYFPNTECGCIDPVRNALMVLSTRAGTALGQFKCFQVNLSTGVRTEIAFNPSAALTAFQALNTNHGGFHYDPHLDCFYYYFGGTGQGGRVWKVTPNGGTTWDIEELTMTGVTVPAGVGVANGNLLTRFRYVPRLKAVYAFPAAGSPIYCARMS